MAIIEVDDRGLSEEALELLEKNPKTFAKELSGSWGKENHGWWVGRRPNPAVLARARVMSGRSPEPPVGIGFERFDDLDGLISALLQAHDVPFRVVTPGKAKLPPNRQKQAGPAKLMASDTEPDAPPPCPNVCIVNGAVVVGPGLIFSLPNPKESPWGHRYAVSAFRYKLATWLAELGVKTIESDEEDDGN